MSFDFSQSTVTIVTDRGRFTERVRIEADLITWKISAVGGGDARLDRYSGLVTFDGNQTSITHSCRSAQRMIE